MAAYQVLLLNTAIPQIQAAQSGDTYVVPRDIAFSAKALIGYTDYSGVGTNGLAVAGNVGIGTSSPVNKLDVQAGFISTYDPTNANGAGYSVRFYTDANAGSRAEVARIGGIQEGAGNNGRIVFATSTSGSVTEKMTLSSDGTFRVKGAGTVGSTDAVQFSGSAPADAMRLDSSGNVGIGTTSPNISGGAAGSQVLTISASASGRNGFLELKGTRTTTDQISSFISSYSNSGATPITRIGSWRGADDVTGYLTFETSNTEKARITSGGNLDLQKNLGLGAASATTSGTGITFPATQSASSDANTLDDYEEGTYVVTFTPSTSGSITLDSSFNELSYIKVGSQVTIFGRVLISSVSSPTGAIQINLPFAPETGLADQSDFYAMPIMTHDVDLSAGALTVFGESTGTNYLVVYQTVDNAAWALLPSANLKGNGNEYFYITGSYRAA